MALRPTALSLATAWKTAWARAQMVTCTRVAPLRQGLITTLIGPSIRTNTSTQQKCTKYCYRDLGDCTLVRDVYLHACVCNPFRTTSGLLVWIEKSLIEMATRIVYPNNAGNSGLPRFGLVSEREYGHPFPRYLGHGARQVWHQSDFYNNITHLYLSSTASNFIFT